MGCGKSVVGQRVARQIGWTFIDCDTYIEKRIGVSIPEIFENFGEEYFRTLETKVLLELTEGGERLVLATGGGLPTQERNWAILEKNFVTFFLRVSFPLLFERIRESPQRPLVKKYPTPQELRRLYEQRIPFYERAHVIIDADFLTEEEVAEKIIFHARDYGLIK